MSILDTPLGDLELSANTVGVCAKIGVTSLEGVLVLDADSGLPPKVWKEVKSFQETFLARFNPEAAASALDFLQNVMDVRRLSLILQDGRLHLIRLSDEGGDEQGRS